MRKAGEGVIEKATFAAGCFWGVEEAFRNVRGVVSTRVGYTGGNTRNPSYKDVCTSMTGHAEAVEITFDLKMVAYEKLLEIFWSVHDPTQLNRQGPDTGTQYRSAIFYHSKRQKEAAMVSRTEQEKHKGRITTEIRPAAEFYEAEEYHQKYLMKKGLKVC